MFDDNLNCRSDSSFQEVILKYVRSAEKLIAELKELRKKKKVDVEGSIYIRFSHLELLS